MKKSNLYKNILVLFILCLAFFLRSYKFEELFIYNHDHDLASWIIKDIVVNGHIRLIGQETSVSGVFIGALFYYLLILFYWFGKMDPLGGVFLSIAIGVLTTFSVYYVFGRIINSRAGLVGGLIYAVSFLIVFTDREVVPTTLAMPWTVWYLYCLFLLHKNDFKKAFILLGVLLGLIWHVNLALVILTPLILIPIIFSKKKPNLKNIILGLLIFLVVSLPLGVFELRHGFQQTRAITLSLFTNKNYISGTAVGLAKLDRVMQLVYKNSSRLFYETENIIPVNLSPHLLMGLLFLLVIIKKISKYLFWVCLFWLLLYIGFFSKNPLNISEYYLNGMNIIWILIASTSISELVSNSRLKFLGYTLLSAFLIINFYRFFNYVPSRNGYVERKAVVAFINEDRKNRGYPCIAISYITSPGYGLGYRYFFWLNNMHVNAPISGSPVYSIVFPHTKVNRLDKTFGALGLVLPDYSKYTKEAIAKSCDGQNSNVTDPMFGYVE